MGLFDWLKSAAGNVRMREDAVWLTQRAKFDGIAGSLQQRFEARHPPACILLIGHFPDCAKQLGELVSSSVAGDRRVLVTLADRLASATASLNELDETHRIEIIVAQRHPLESHEQPILDFAQRLPHGCQVEYHLSLDDPLMRIFAGPKIQNLLKQMGMKANEPIASRLITRHIKSSLKKIEAESHGDSPADSAEAWFEHNCPALWRA